MPYRASPLDGEVCGALWGIADWCLYTFVHIKQQDAIRVLLFYASMMKISSMGTEKTWAIRQARTREGLYRPFSRLPMVSRRTPTPVSYTHLDVYKRQLLGLGQVPGGGVGPMGVQLHVEAVSYTHLDVYKRQILGCFWANWATARAFAQCWGIRRWRVSSPTLSR